MAANEAIQLRLPSGIEHSFVPGDPDYPLAKEIQRLTDALNGPRAERPGPDVEAYTVDQIRAAFTDHASPDGWGIPSFYESVLIASLRGEYEPNNWTPLEPLEAPEGGVIDV